MTLSKREQIIMKIGRAMVEAFLEGKNNEAEIMTVICKDEGLSHNETVRLCDDVTKFAIGEGQ